MNQIVETDAPEAFAQELAQTAKIMPRRFEANPGNVDKGLAKLVLTLIEMLRKLMEKQAMRRVASGSLTEAQIESVGETLMKLEQKMDELKKVFGLNEQDLNINLGPLGDLM